MHQEASRRVARPDGCAAAAPVERVGVGGERQSARTALGAVAAQALRRKNRVYLLLVIDGWQLAAGLSGIWLCPHHGPHAHHPQAGRQRENQPYIRHPRPAGQPHRGLERYSAMIFE